MTQKYCYGTISNFAQNNGQYSLQTFVRMASKLLVLILALTSCLTEKVYCQMTDGSGNSETEHLLLSHFSVEEDFTEVNTKEEDTEVIAYEQASLEHANTLVQDQTSSLNKTPEANNETTGTVNVEPALLGNSTVNNKGRVFKQADTTESEAEENEDEKQKMDEDDEWYSFIFIILLCLIVGLLLMALVAAGVLIKRSRRKKKTVDSLKSDPFLDCEDGEKIPMPMFEDDVPSVMELEMEDFEKWVVKEGNYHGVR